MHRDRVKSSFSSNVLTSQIVVANFEIRLSVMLCMQCCENDNAMNILFRSIEIMAEDTKFDEEN